MLLISFAPKPVKVRRCFGLLKSGPIGPCRSEIGALVDGRRSLVLVGMFRGGTSKCVEFRKREPGSIGHWDLVYEG